MEWVSYQKFLFELRETPAWRLEMGEHGLTLLTTDAEGTVSVFHSPDPKSISHFDWVRFSTEIGLIISLKASA
jgi:hypothetical protein